MEKEKAKNEEEKIESSRAPESPPGAKVM